MRSGSIIGNMWKSVLSNIDSMTPKVQDAFKQLGISLTTTGSNGQQQMKKMWEIINDLAQVTQHATSAQAKYLTVIAGGKFQYDTMTAALSNANTLTKAYQDSLQSQGKAAQLAAAQMNTLHAQLQRMQDSFQKMAFDSENNNGLASFLKDGVKLVADFTAGLEKVPTWLIAIGASAVTIYPIFSRLRTGILSIGQNLVNAFSKGIDVISFIVDKIGKDLVESVDSSTAATVKNTVAQNANKNSMGYWITQIKLARDAKIADSIATDAESASVGVLSTTEGVATGTTMTLSAALKGLILASAPLVGALTVLGGVAFAAVTTAMGNQQQAADQTSQQFNELTQAYQSNRQQADALLATYSRLDQATNHGSVFKDKNQEQQYYSVMQDIANVLPNVTDYVDANGRAHVKVASVIKNEIDLQEQLLKAQAQQQIDQFAANYQKQIDNIAKYRNQIQSAGDSLNKLKDIQSQNVDVTYRYDNAAGRLKARLQTLTTQQDQANVAMGQAQIAMQNMSNSYANLLLQARGVTLSDSNQGLLNQLLGQVDFSKMQNNVQQVQSVITSIVNIVAKEQNSAKGAAINVDQLNNSVRKLGTSVPWLGDGFKTLQNNVKSASGSVVDASMSMHTLNQQVANVISNNKLLDQAEANLNKTGHLSVSMLTELVKKYPDLTNVIGQGSDAILAFIQNEKNSSAQTIVSEQIKTQVVIDETKKRIAAIQAEIANEKDLMAVQSAEAQLNIATIPLGNLGKSQKQLSDAEAQLKDAEARMKALNVGYSAIMSVGDSNLSSGSSKTRGLSSANAITPAMNDTTAAVKQAQAAMEGYNKTSVETLSSLEKQVTLQEKLRQQYEQRVAQFARQGNRKEESLFNIKVANATKEIDKLEAKIEELRQKKVFDKMDESATTLQDKVKTLQDAIDMLGDSENMATARDKTKMQDAQIVQYERLMSQIDKNIQYLEREGRSLDKNTILWTNNQAQLKKWESTALQTASSIRSLVSSIQSSIIDEMEQLKQTEDDAITNQEQHMQDRIKNLQSSGKQFDMSDWKSNFADISNTLNEIDGKFDASPFVDTTGTVRNNLKTYNEQLQRIARTVDSMTASSSGNISGLFKQITNEVKYANQLKGTLTDVNEQIKQNTLAFKQQEDEMQEKIKQTTQAYDTQIKALQEKSKILDEQLTQSDRLQQLQDEQTKLDQAMQDKTFTYINSQGQETHTFDVNNVNKIKQEQDKLLDQFQRQDIKDAIQSQIDALNQAKTDSIDALQTQLDNMKNIHQEQLASLQDYSSTLSGLLQGLNSDIQDKSQNLSQLFSDEKTKVDQSWKDMEDAIKKGTKSISDIMSPKSSWYQNTIETLKRFNIDISAPIAQIIQQLAQLGSLNSQLSNLENNALKSEGLPTISTSTGTTHSTVTSTDVIHQANPGVTISSGGMMVRRQFHDGGIIGSINSPATDIVNKLFNTQPNEQIVKALIGELMVPADNITKNFIPNMKSFIVNNSNSSSNDKSNIVQYDIHDFTVQPNDINDFVTQIEHLATSERR